jgi:hypothetical protein
VTIDGVCIGDLIYWPLVHTTWNYNQLQRHRLSPQFTYRHSTRYACCVFNSRSLATTYSSRNSSASYAHVVSARPITRNWTLVDCQLDYNVISSEPSLQSSTELSHSPTNNHFTSLQSIELHSRAGVTVTLRLTVYRKSVRLSAKHLETRNQHFFSPNWTLAVIVLMLSFTINSCLRQRSHSQVRFPRDSWPHFTVLDSRLPQPGGPCPRIYIPWEQGGQVVPPDTGFPFRRLLRLAGLRWRYATPPPHGLSLHSAGLGSSLYSLWSDPTKTPFLHAERVLFFAGTCLPSRCFETNGITQLFY